VVIGEDGAGQASWPRGLRLEARHSWLDWAAAIGPAGSQAPRTLGLPFSLPHSPLVGSSSLRRSARPLRSPPADLRAAACGAMPAGGGWPCPPRAARSQPASGLPSPDGSLFPGGQARSRWAAGCQRRPDLQAPVRQRPAARRSSAWPRLATVAALGDFWGWLRR